MFFKMAVTELFVVMVILSPSVYHQVESAPSAPLNPVTLFPSNPIAAFSSNGHVLEGPPKDISIISILAEKKMKKGRNQQELLKPSENRKSQNTSDSRHGKSQVIDDELLGIKYNYSSIVHNLLLQHVQSDKKLNTRPSQTDTSSLFNNIKDLLPDWIWAIIICAITICVLGVFYLFTICIPCKYIHKTNISDHTQSSPIQSISFQTLQDLYNNLEPCTEKMDTDKMKPFAQNRNMSIGSMNVYNLGDNYFHINSNDYQNKDFITSWVQLNQQQKIPKSMFKTMHFPKCFTQLRRTTNFKQMDDLLQAYHSLNSPPNK